MDWIRLGMVWKCLANLFASYGDRVKNEKVVRY